MKLVSVLSAASLIGVGLAVPAGILDKICGPNYDADDCIDPNQIWGCVEEPTENPQPTSVVTPTATPAANPPAADPKDACFDESDKVYQQCKKDGKKERVCLDQSDKVEIDCLKKFGGA